MRASNKSIIIMAVVVWIMQGIILPEFAQQEAPARLRPLPLTRHTEPREPPMVSRT